MITLEKNEIEKCKELIGYACDKCDAVLFVFRKDLYIKAKEYKIINKISKILNISIEQIENDYKNIIKENKNVILNKMGKENTDIEYKILLLNVENEIESKKNYEIQDKMMKQIKNELKEDLIKERHNPEWSNLIVGNKYEEPQYNNEYLFDICIYKLSLNVKKFINKNNNIYNWKAPYLPDDLCFLRKKYYWMASITHEEQFYIFPENNAEYQHLKKMGIKLSEEYKGCYDKEEYILEEYIIE